MPAVVLCVEIRPIGPYLESARSGKNPKSSGMSRIASMPPKPIIGGSLQTETVFERISRRTIICLVTPFLIAGAISSYRAYVQVRRLDIHVDGSTLAEGSGARADVVSSGRVPVTLRLELVQGTRAETLGEKIVPTRRDPFLDPRAVQGTLSVAVTAEVLARFAPGPALLRATARGRPQWLREPPPLVREAAVVIQNNSRR